MNTIGSMLATIMGGEREAKIELATLADTKHLYAVGPLAGLVGEITIINSRPSLARVGANGAVSIDQAFSAGAPFLVWTNVERWKEEELPESVQSLTDLETHLSRILADRKLPDAFPFTISGRVRSIGYHVLNADPRSPLPSGPQAHSAIQARFETGPSDVTLVGFYSTIHQGVFIHRGAVTHIHFQDRDNAQSGHVDDLEFGAGPFILKTPL